MWSFANHKLKGQQSRDYSTCRLAMVQGDSTNEGAGIVVEQEHFIPLKSVLA